MLVVCGSFFKIVFIFLVKYKLKLLVERENERRGVGSLRKEEGMK